MRRAFEVQAIWQITIKRKHYCKSFKIISYETLVKTATKVRGFTSGSRLLVAQINQHTKKLKHMKETALERLSRIKTQSDFENWSFEGADYSHQTQLIEEVVTLAKAKKQPTIDAMRFEAAKAFLQGITSHKGHVTNTDISDAANLSDALIAELQKTKP